MYESFLQEMPRKEISKYIYMVKKSSKCPLCNEEGETRKAFPLLR